MPRRVHPAGAGDGAPIGAEADAGQSPVLPRRAVGAGTRRIAVQEAADSSAEGPPTAAANELEDSGRIELHDAAPAGRTAGGGVGTPTDAAGDGDRAAAGGRPARKSNLKRTSVLGLEDAPPPDSDGLTVSFHPSVAGGSPSNARGGRGAHGRKKGSWWVDDSKLAMGKHLVTLEEADESAAAHSSSLPTADGCWWRFWERHVLGGTMPQLTAWAAAHSKIVLFLDSLLRGLGQVVFLNNPVTGLFVVAAAAYNSTYIMTMGLAGTVAATLVALLFGLSPEATRGGLFGYNGFLTGAALALFQAGHSGSEWNPLVVAPVVLCSALSTLVTIALAHVCANISKDPAPCFTFPFHLVTWMWLLGSQGYAYFPNDLGSPALATPTTVDDRNLLDYDAAELFLAVPRGVAQVFLFSEFWSGVIILVGMAIASPMTATAAAAGSLIGMATAVAVGAPTADIYDGLWGFNPVLAAIAVSGMFFVPKTMTMVLALFASIASALLFGALGKALSPMGMPALTFPGALACLLFVLMGNSLNRIRRVPLAMVTVPEEHLGLLEAGIVSPASGRVNPAAALRPGSRFSLRPVSASAWSYVEDM